MSDPDLAVVIEPIAVKSSNIKAVGYDVASKTLEVEFAGGDGTVYRYGGVEEATFRALVTADSVGGYLHREITKDTPYPFTKLDQRPRGDAEPVVSAPRLVTIGYARRRPPQLKAKLVAAGVQIVLDVRATAMSRAYPAYGARRLERLFAPEMEYNYTPLLGPVDEGFSWPGEALDLVVHWLYKPRVVALLCVERNVERCHRLALTARLIELVDGLVVEHIE